MTSKTSILSIIDKYNALTVPDQTVLQALSALYEPAAAQVVANCLAGAGCRESHLRAFSPQIVATRLSRLAKAGFVQEQSAENRAQKILLWRVRAEVGEVAIRHAVRDGRFLPIAKAALAETHGRDWKGEGADDSPQRRFHLAFHAGDWRLALQAMGNISQTAPGSGGTFLANLLRLQPDDSWRRTASPAAFGPILAAALRDATDGLADPGPMPALAAEILEKETKNPATTGDLPFTLVENLTLRGKLREAFKIAQMVAAEHSPLVTLPPALAEGRSDAPELAENAMARRRGNSSGVLPPDSGAVWIALAIMTGDLPDSLEGMIRRLSATSMQNHPDAGALSALRHAFLFMGGQASAARLLSDRPADPKTLTQLCHALALLRIDPFRLEKIAPDLGETAALAAKSGYQWFSLQLESLAAIGAGRPEPEGRWPLLTRFFKEEDSWRRGLKALEDLTREPGDDTVPSGKRLAWLVNFPPHPEDIFMPFEIQPIEQSLGKDGQWSKGRNVALRRIFQHAPDFDYITDADRMVFATLRYDFDGVAQGFHFDTGLALSHLIGHPLVFRGDDSGARLDVEPGRFELSVTDQEGGCEIALEPALADFVPEGHSGEELLDAARGDKLVGTLARMETPTRLRVYPLNERERQLARVVGDGLTIPARGRDEALRTLGKLSGLIHMHSDIPELAGVGEMVSADSRPRFHITPQTVGVRVEVWAHPLGDDGPAYRPGRGGKMLTAAVDGKLLKTRRDAAAEKTRAAEAVAACGALSGREDGDLSWRLEDPEAALSFFAETEDL